MKVIMKNIQKHLDHMFAGNQTTLSHMTDELLAEISSVNLDRRALEQLGRHVLSLISDDLKSGIRAQKVLYTAMGSARND